MKLSAGERVDPHTHAGKRIVLSVWSGELELTLDDESFTFEAGDVIRFDGDHEVSPRAIEDSEALIVLADRTE